jgi:hypothetical protein
MRGLIAIIKSNKEVAELYKANQQSVGSSCGGCSAELGNRVSREQEAALGPVRRSDRGLSSAECGTSYFPSFVK